MEFDDLLDDKLSTTNRYNLLPDASKGKRFTNYLIDQACMFVFGFGIGAGLVVMDPAIADSWLFTGGTITDYLFGAVIALLYYPLTEGLLNGKSIGKFITGTRAVRQDGRQASLQDVLLRTLSRLVPFETFSFLGNDNRGWHDEWTKTKVVDERIGNNKGVY